MTKTLAALTALFVSMALFTAGNGLLQTLVPVNLTGIGMPVERAAPILAGHYVGLVLGALGAGTIIERVGHIRAFAAFASLVVIAALIHGLTAPAAWWFVLRVMAGASIAGLSMVGESWVNDRVPSQSRGTILSLYMVVSFTALVSGQFILVLGPPMGFELFSVTALIFAAAVIPLSVVRISAPTLARRPRIGFGALYRISPLAFVGCAFIGLMNGAFYPLGPIFARAIGLDLAGVSWFMGCAIAGGMLLQFPIGRLSDRVDRRKVLMGVATAACALSLIMVLASRTPEPFIYPAVMLYGGCAFTLYPLCVTHANDFAAQEQRIATSGGLLMAFGIGAAVGGPLAAPLMSAAGPSGLFLFTAVISGCLAGFTAYRMSRRAPPVQRENFVPSPPPSVAVPPVIR